MSTGGLAIGLAVLATLAGCRQPTNVISGQCGVSVTMPGGPVAYQSHVFTVEGGELTSHQYRSLQHGVTFGLICTPDANIPRQTPEGMRDSARKGFLSSGERTLVAEHDVTLESVRGHELVMKTADHAIRNRVFPLGDALVNVSVIGTEAGVTSPAADSFFASLRVMRLRQDEGE